MPSAKAQPDPVLPESAGALASLPESAGALASLPESAGALASSLESAALPSIPPELPLLVLDVLLLEALVLEAPLEPLLELA